MVLRANEEPITTMVDLALCAPSSCNDSAAVELADFHLAPLVEQFGGSLQMSSCYEKPNFDVAGVAVFSTVSIALFALVFIATFTRKSENTIFTHKLKI
jgi:hypothetical protein